MKIIKKVMIIILTSIVIVFSLIPPKITFADNDITTNQEKVGNAIADTAIDFFNRFATSTVYDYGRDYEYNGIYVPDSWGRKKAYQNIMTSGMAYRNLGNGYKELEVYSHKYAIDCVGFVSMIIHRATGLGNSTFSYFGVPTTCYGTDYTHFEKVTFENTVETLPGDIICWSGHVAIAIGNGMMIDSGNSGPNGQITKRPISNYSTSSYRVIRIKASVANTLVENDSLNTTWYEKAKYQASPSASETDDDNNDDVDDNSNKYEIKENPFGNADEFYYNGMPLSGHYLGHDDSNWLIDALSSVADWLVGIITLGYKIQIVGWTAIVQNIATDVVNSIVNSKSGQAITAENILFNHIQILDIDFFDSETAGGEKITSDDLVYNLRQNVAGIYYSIRNIAIIVLLVILIYVGIRMALSTVSGDKVKYKKMFWSWCVGFIVVMFIHYFMIVVINVNEQIINSLSPSDSATVIYDEARSYAYEIPASKGWTGTIVYVFLVYYMIKLLLFYFKRLMVVYLLAIMGPIMGLTYAVEMIKGKSRSFTTWMKEFSFNVLIQSVHVIIYCVFMNIIYEFIKEVNIVNLMPYAIIMVLVLNLMMKSEKIVKRIFGLKSNTMKDIADTVLQTSGTVMTGLAIASPIYKAGKNKVIKSYNNRIDNAVDNKYKHLENSKEAIEKSKLATDIQREIDRLKKEEKDRIKQYDANTIALGKSIFKGISGMVSSVPMTFEAGPVEGTLSIINSASNLNARLGKIEMPEIDEARIDELLEKYNMNPVNPNRGSAGNNAQGTLPIFGSTPTGSSTPTGVSTPIGSPTSAGSSTTNSSTSASAPKSNSTSSSVTIRSLNTEKNKKYNAKKGVLGFAVASATARTSTRVKNIMKDGKAEREKLDDPYQTARIELLYQLQGKVLEEEARLDSAIGALKSKGFPPVFYTPQENESESSIAMNMSLKEQYANLLKINLRQAIAGNPSVTKEEVAEQIANYTTDTGHAPTNLVELQQVLDKIAQENDYDLGTEFENNLRGEIAKNAMDVVEDKETQINSEAIRDEVLRKVRQALENNNWDEESSKNDVMAIITKDIAEEVMGKIPASELTSIITSAINSEGSLKNKPVAPEFEQIVENAVKVADIKSDIAELSEDEKYDPEELINEILNKDILD